MRGRAAREGQVRSHEGEEDENVIWREYVGGGEIWGVYLFCDGVIFEINDDGEFV